MCAPAPTIFNMKNSADVCEFFVLALIVNPPPPPHLLVVGAGVAKRSTAALVFTLFPDKVLGEPDVEVEFETTEISLSRCSYQARQHGVKRELESGLCKAFRI